MVVLNSFARYGRCVNVNRAQHEHMCRVLRMYTTHLRHRHSGFMPTTLRTRVDRFPLLQPTASLPAPNRRLDQTGRHPATDGGGREGCCSALPYPFPQPPPPPCDQRQDWGLDGRSVGGVASGLGYPQAGDSWKLSRITN
jgi:hypothetical protein